MAIPLLNLDDRTFQDMMAEVQALIPRHAPAWTNRNLSDPGVTLLELFAWVTEAMLFRINRVPDASRQRFLELLGASFQSPQPAKLKLTVTAVTTNGARCLPRHTVVFVFPDPQTDAIPFETIEDTVFTSDLPTRTVIVRQTSLERTKAPGDGQPFQLMRLPAPLALPPSTTHRPPVVWVGDDSDREYWQYTPELRAARADDRRFAIHTRTNAVVFGDGNHGMIPPMGAQITIVHRTSSDPQELMQRQTVRSSGAPNQVVRLAAPLLPCDLQPSSDLEPQVTVAERRWAYSPSIFDFEPGAHVFSAEPWANGLRFGNTARGKIPGANADIVVSYRSTLGRIHSLPAATRFVFDTPSAADFRVETFQVVAAGAPGTTLDEAREQAFELIKTRWRSVTTADFAAVLTREQQDIHRVQCLPGDDLDEIVERQPAQIGVLVTPRPRHVLEHEAGGVGTLLTFDPTGRSLVTSAADGDVWLWNLVTGQRVALLSESGVNSVTYSSDGARLVVVKQNGHTTLYDVQTGARLFSLVTTISVLSPDGRRWFTVAAEAAGAAHLRAGDDGAAFARLSIASPVTHAQFSQDGMRLITAHAGGSEDAGHSFARMWDATDGSASATIIELDGAVSQFVTGEDGRSLGVIGMDGSVAVWNPAWRQVLMVRTGSPLKLAQIDPTVTRLATITETGMAQLWSLRTGDLIASLDHPQAVSGARFGPAGERVATFDQNGGIRLWQAKNGNHDLDLNASAPISALAFHRSGKRLAVIVEPPLAVAVWDLAHPGRPILQRRSEAFPLQPPAITSAVLSTTGDWLAWTEKNLATVWDIAQGRTIATLHHSREYVGLRLARLNPADRLVVTTMERNTDAARNCRVQVWDAGVVQEARQVLARRHLLTSEVHVRGPSFIQVGVRAVLVRSLPPRQSLEALVDTVKRTLLEFFDPLTGGPDKSGWSLGREVHASEVYQVMEQTPGIDHVESLCIFTSEGLAADVEPTCLEHVPILPHHLVNCVLDAASIRIIDPERMPFAVTV